MSNIFVRQIVGSGTYGVPESDAELSAATAGLDALISGIANLSYGALLAWVEDSGGPGGAEGTRTLNCLIQTFTFFGEECPPEEGASGIDTLVGLVESTLEGDPNISSIDVQQYSLYQTPSAPTSGDKRGPVIIVGNAPAGDTDADCDYLDTGNCDQLAAAIAASGPNDDVYIRPGTYDFGQVGSPASRISIPAGARVRGAGRHHVTVQTRTDGGDGRAFILSGDGSALEDIRVFSPAPTAPQSGGYGLVEVNADDCDLERVDCEFDWAGITDPWDAAIDTGVYAYSCTDFRMVDCRALNVPKLYQEPGPVMNGFYLSSISRLSVRGIYVSGADTGGTLSSCTAAQIDEMFFDGFRHEGLVIGGSDYSNISTGQFISDGLWATARGIAAGSSSDYIAFTDLSFQVTGASQGEAGILLFFSDYCIVKGVRGDGKWDGRGLIWIDTACDDTIITSCQCNGDGIYDIGNNTHAAHNIL